MRFSFPAASTPCNLQRSTWLGCDVGKVFCLFLLRNLSHMSRFICTFVHTPETFYTRNLVLVQHQILHKKPFEPEAFSPAAFYTKRFLHHPFLDLFAEAFQTRSLPHAFFTRNPLHHTLFRNHSILCLAIFQNPVFKVTTTLCTASEACKSAVCVSVAVNVCCVHAMSPW